MPRRKQTKLDDGSNWAIFGEWLTQQRLYRRLTQDQAAKAIDVSRHQWMRYESGKKVLRKHMEAMAPILKVTLEKMLDRAGLKASPKRNAVRAKLSRMYDYVGASRLDFAILELLRVYDEATGCKGGVGPRSGGLEATNFANAVVMINRLPAERVEELLNLMKERIKDKSLKPEVPLPGKNRIRKKRADKMLFNGLGHQR
jgi:transcriptional regulator with XRE-family HTH domain